MLLLDVPDEKLLTIAKDIPETNLLQTSSTTKSQQKKSKAEEELIDLIPEEEEKDEKLSPTKSKVKPKTYTLTLHFLFGIYFQNSHFLVLYQRFLREKSTKYSSTSACESL